MTQVYWLGQTETNVPPANDWLSETERDLLSRFRFPKRRSEWRLGRWTAKCAVASYYRGLSMPMSTIDVRPATSGAPEVYINGRLAPLSISLSHRSGQAMCALAPPDTAIGCDVELSEARSDSFVTDYFTEDERVIVSRAGDDRSLIVTLLWSVKESVLKAVRLGLRADTRDVNVVLGEPDGFDDDRWRALSARLGGRPFTAWWRRTGALVWTVVSAPAADVLIPLQQA